MHWRFVPLFSIAVYHSKYKNPDPDTGESPPKAPDFSFEPSESTARRLARLGWVFKSQAGSCTVYGEKTVKPDGTDELRGVPGDKEGFSFFLRLSNASLLNETKPYVLASQPDILPNGSLPAFSGRSRLLYFDNLNPTAKPTGELLLTADPVDVAQLGSRAPIPFEFDKAAAATTELAITPYEPGGVAQTVALNPATRRALINLPENGYRIVQKPGNATETIFFSAQLPPEGLLGVVRIFQPPGGTGWEPPQRRYQIIFEKV